MATKKKKNKKAKAKAYKDCEWEENMASTSQELQICSITNASLACPIRGKSPKSPESTESQHMQNVLNCKSQSKIVFCCFSLSLSLSCSRFFSCFLCSRFSYFLLVFLRIVIRSLFVISVEFLHRKLSFCQTNDELKYANLFNMLAQTLSRPWPGARHDVGGWEGYRLKEPAAGGFVENICSCMHNKQSTKHNANSSWTHCQGELCEHVNL